MVNFENFFNQLLNDVKIGITDEFDRNFERKAFFDRKWPDAKYPNTKGSLLMRTGALRRSIMSKIQGHEIHFTSSEIYASIQNEGGEIMVTAKMVKYFWAMFYKATRGRKGVVNVETEYWKAMALMKVGTKLKIPSRRFIGPHPAVDAEMQRIARENIGNLENDINQMLESQGLKVGNIRFK